MKRGSSSCSMIEQGITLRKLLLFVEAFARMACCRLALLVLPFETLSAHLVRPGREMPMDPMTLRCVKWALDAVQRRIPLLANCWASAAAGMGMLKRRGIPAEIYLGVMQGSLDGMKAHAWLRVGDLVLSGVKGHRRYTVVAVLRWGEIQREFPRQVRDGNGFVHIEDGEAH